MAIFRCRTLIRAGQNKNKIKEAQKFWMNQITIFWNVAGDTVKKRRLTSILPLRTFFFFGENTFITIADLNCY